MSNKYYAGIGSRETPNEFLTIMVSLSTHLDTRGYILRSGGAKGADKAFERGTKKKEIYLPSSSLATDTGIKTIPNDIWVEAERIARNHHPAWGYLKPFSRNLMTRNTFQILGLDLNTPSDFVVCWTQDGCEDGNRTSRKTGGTGQALRLAAKMNIPIYNLGNPKTAENLWKIV